MLVLMLYVCVLVAKFYNLERNEKMSTRVIASRPIRMWIHGKCFSIKRYERKSNKKKKNQIEESYTHIEGSEHFINENFHTVHEENGKFFTKFKVPKLYYSKIHNFSEFNIKEFSKKTETIIELPQAGHEGEIIMQSDTKLKLFKAVDEIHTVIAEIRRRNIALQFVCIPCLSDHVKEKFENLKTEILELENVKGMHESIFQNPQKLHLTINVFVLLDDKEKEEAVSTLNEYKDSILDPLLKETGPLTIDISGLDSMNKNIKNVDVLFAKAKLVEESDKCSLQSIVDGLSQHFYHRGLAREHQENVKLHMTIINTKYRKTPGSPKRKFRRVSFDATKILEKYKDYSFGQCNFESIHLSHILSKGEDGFYKPISVVKLNQ